MMYYCIIKLSHFETYKITKYSFAMTVLFSSSYIFRSFSFASSSSTSSEISEYLVESDCSCCEQEQETLDEELEEKMNILASASSIFSKKLQSSSNQSKQQPQQQQIPQNQPQQQQQTNQQKTGYDIEEATPPPSSQRLDPSRRRNTSGVDEHHQLQPIPDDEIKAIIVPKPPASNNRVTVPLGLNQSSNHATNNSSVCNKENIPEIKLIHPFLNKVPLQFRFIFNGILSNLIFMIVYNNAVTHFVQRFPASAIYSIVYLLFIPIGHLTGNLLVFGWPEYYFQSLISNYPIGLTAIAIGSLLTAYLDQIKFNQSIEEYVYDNWTFNKMPDQRQEYVSEKSEFYSSMVVLVVTSIWTYILSIWVNSHPTTSEKKEL